MHVVILFGNVTIHKRIMNGYLHLKTPPPPVLVDLPICNVRMEWAWFAWVPRTPRANRHSYYIQVYLRIGYDGA